MSTGFYKAVVIQQGVEPHFKVTDLRLPKLGPRDLLVKLSVTGVCGTDLALATGKLGPCRPILGHEGIGRVVNRGCNLDEMDVRIGQRVGVSWVRDSCNNCEMCLREGGDVHCIQQLHSGRKVDGTFAQYTVVPFNHLIRLPEGGPSDEQLAPIMCAGVTAYKALKVCGAIPGQWIVISGAGGGVGALAIQYAHAMGYQVVAIDSGGTKRDYCMNQLEADEYLDIQQTEIANNLPTAVKSVTGGQGAAAVLVVAGSARAYQDGLDILAPFGTLVCAGIPPATQSVQFHPLQFIDRNIRVVGTMVGSAGDILEAVQFVRRQKVRPQVEVVTLDDIDRIMKSLLLMQVSL